MLVKDIKPIGKVGKNLLENKNADEIIEKIIEMPLRKVCKEFKQKNIETAMSSANRKNIVKDERKVVRRIDVIEKSKKKSMQTFLRAGKGYAWVMLNYNTLSDKNREILFNMEQELGEDAVWFVKSNYVEFLNAIRKPLRLKPIIEKFDDKYSEKFKSRQLLLTYNNKYPRRSVFIRMPINEETKVDEVENYFDKIISRFEKQ